MLNGLDLEEQIKQATQQILLREYQARQMPEKPGPIQIFRIVQSDLDQDGSNEVCFAAGVADLWGAGVCGILDPLPEGGFDVVELAPFVEGFRELVIQDINVDGVPEVISWWQVGSGAFLSILIYQWNGTSARSLFPDQRFSQGMLETKDLDADGHNEALVWESIWEGGANWGPKRYRIHVFAYNGEVYDLLETRETERRYYPSAVIGRTVGIMGLPTEYAHRYTSVTALREQFNSLAKQDQVTEQFIVELHQQLSVLRREGFYREALEIADLALEATASLDKLAKARSLVAILTTTGLVHSLMGDYPAAVDSYQRALSAWVVEAAPDFAPTSLANLYRELGVMQWMTGDYEGALSALSLARQHLEQLDLSSPEVEAEFSRLLSNLGLVYSQFGEAVLAKEAFEKALSLDKALEIGTGEAINHKGLGDSVRALGDINGAVESYHAALGTMDSISDRDRESDIYLELGLTHIMAGEAQRGLDHLQYSLLLTSEGNLMQQGAKHYLYLAEAYRRTDRPSLAKRCAAKCIELVERFNIAEVLWMAWYSLARLHHEDGSIEAEVTALENAIRIIEGLYTQYLPAPLKVTFVGGRAAPYEAMVRICYSAAARPRKVEARLIDNRVAFHYVERAKSRVFLEELTATSLSNTADLPQQLIERETELMARLREAQIRHRVGLANQQYDWHRDQTHLEEQLSQVWHRLLAVGTRGAEYVALRKGAPLEITEAVRILRAL